MHMSGTVLQSQLSTARLASEMHRLLLMVLGVQVTLHRHEELDGERVIISIALSCSKACWREQNQVCDLA